MNGKASSVQSLNGSHLRPIDSETQFTAKHVKGSPFEKFDPKE